MLLRFPLENKMRRGFLAHPPCCGLLRSCCPAAPSFHQPDSAQSGSGTSFPIYPPLSMCKTDCIQSAMNHKYSSRFRHKIYLCSTHTGVHLTSYGYSLQTIHLGDFFWGNGSFISIDFRSSHVFS